MDFEYVLYWSGGSKLSDEFNFYSYLLNRPIFHTSSKVEIGAVCFWNTASSHEILWREVGISIRCSVCKYSCDTFFYPAWTWRGKLWNAFSQHSDIWPLRINFSTTKVMYHEARKIAHEAFAKCFWEYGFSLFFHRLLKYSVVCNKPLLCEHRQ
jgi:hypothetical protein